MKSFSAFLLLITLNVLVIGQSRVYDFPIKPGTIEWDSLKTFKDRLNAYNVPEELLKNMNTSTQDYQELLHAK